MLYYSLLRGFAYMGTVTRICHAQLKWNIEGVSQTIYIVRASASPPPTPLPPHPVTQDCCFQ